jgi:F-type H+-transporting ATPase subunit b
MDIDLTFIFQFAIFLIVLVGLNGILFKPFQALIEEREKRIEGNNEEAQRLFLLASQDQGAYEARIKEAKLVAQRERESLRVEGRDEGRELISDVRSELTEVMVETRAKVSIAEQEASQTLTNDIEGLSRQVVEKVLGRQLA